jgi:hypothetical protein
MLREEHRLRVFEENILTYKGEVTGGCRKLYSEELCNQYSSQNIIGSEV